jgi:hypothetical protein
MNSEYCQRKGFSLLRLFVFLAWCTTPILAQAHLVAARSGTLNLAGTGAFLVLSLPASALRGADEDGDGTLSRDEVQGGAAVIASQLKAGVQLLGRDGPLPLSLLMVDVVPPESTPAAVVNEVTVLGRFQLPVEIDGAGSLTDVLPGGLTLRFDLFGMNADGRPQYVTISRGAEAQWLRFTPELTAHVLLPGTMEILAEYVDAGAAHVLAGFDHLLFLLVVLGAGWSWRGLLGALTCFTAGHALTLVASILGGWSVSASVVEPAIAATIIVIAAIDLWGRSRSRSASPRVRLTLVFIGAMVHGLGFAGALTGLTQWPPGSKPFLWALGGFNLGIELGQIGVAGVASLLVWGLHRFLGSSALRRTSHFATLAATAAGALCFFQRVL